jgi:hypothetical protein
VLPIFGLSTLFWKRGTDDAWRARWAEARARFRGPARATIAAGALGAVAVGSWIFYNTNVLNEYLPSPEAAERRARYERLYRKYRDLDLPRIVAVHADVDLFPDRGRVELRGVYRLRNRSSRPLRDLHLSLPERVHLRRLRLPAHDVVLADRELGYFIYRLGTPLAPGGTLDLGFDLSLGSRGFANGAQQVAVVGNGSFFTKRDLFPVLGYDAHRQLADPEERRSRGLEPALRFAAIDDPHARRNTPRASDADRVELESTVSTALDQIAVTSGELQREWVEGGRRYFRYRAEMPITHYFAYASARYRVTRTEWRPAVGSSRPGPGAAVRPDRPDRPVTIEVYHHPGHGANVGRMVEAAGKSLAYLTANLGPYPHRHLRIVEFPGQVRDATSFPGLLAFSEALGFNARLDGQEPIDFPFYVTAHEVAHQWWGQQVVGADVQGVGLLHESLAQYSALMVLEAEVGRERMRRLLRYELDWYLRGRAQERGAEPPLARAGRQDYVYYHKGALALYALRDAVGEARLNRALARYFSRFALAGPPYTTSRDLLAEIRPLVPAESGQLIEDLFERVTLYDLRIAAATATERPDGHYLVRLRVEGRKLRAGGADGTDASEGEHEIPLDDRIDIEVTGEGETAEGGGPVLVLESRRLRASPAVFELVVGRRPARVAIDPYSKLIDRNRGDDVRAVATAPRAPAAAQPVEPSPPAGAGR